MSLPIMHFCLMDYHLSLNKRSVMAIATICYVIQIAAERENNPLAS
jgi:hypothetical protein